MDELNCFKAYDIRGEIGVTLTPEIAFRIGRAYAAWLQPRRVVIGADVRLSSDELKASLAEGLILSGADVIDLGQTGTEEIYFATRELKADGGIQITASHNPAQYNGMKLVREDARPISNDNGLLEIKRLAERNQWQDSERRGSLHSIDHRPAWAAHLLRRWPPLMPRCAPGVLKSTLFVSTTIPTVTFRLAYRIRCWKKIAASPARRYWLIMPMSAWHGTAISTAVFSLMNAANLSKAIIWLACLPVIFYGRRLAARSFSIRASPGTRWIPSHATAVAR